MPGQEHGRSPPETTTVTMASDVPQPQLPSLADPPAGRSDVATVGTDGSGGDKEEAMGAAGGPLGDFVLIGAPWGLLLSPTPLSSMKLDEKVSAHPPCPAEIMPAAAMGKKKKQCVQCGATETPQWRIHPTGLGALCNACRIRLRPAEALREPVHVPVHLPSPATPPPTVISRREKSPFPAPATAAPNEEKKKRERKRKPRHPPRKSSKQCHHCKSAAAASNPEWSMAPVGRPSTLCDACGMRYRQGRLLQEQEYRPAASPKAIDGSPETHIVDAVGGELQMADPSSLDEFLFNGPSAPPLTDDDEEDFADYVR